MDTLPAAGLAVVLGYLSGSVPFSWLAVRLRTGRDLRTIGSGNVGSTNASRVLGRAWFPVLFLLDGAKGAGPVWATGLFAASGDPGAARWVAVAAAFGAILGHVFPCTLRFKGGKAVATGAGAVFAMSPLALAAGFAGFFVAAVLCRFVSVGSIVAGFSVLGAEIWLSRGDPGWDRTPTLLFLSILALVVLILHLPNLGRIAAGTEPRILERPPPPGTASDGGNAP